LKQNTEEDQINASDQQIFINYSQLSHGQMVVLAFGHMLPLCLCVCVCVCV